MKLKMMTTIGLMLVAGFTIRSASTGVASLSASSDGDRRLRVTKECTAYTGLAGSFCTITSSNVKEIRVGSRVFYDQAAGIVPNVLDSNVVLDAMNGRDRAIGRCTLDLGTGLGLCTFSDGTGRLAGFNAHVLVSPPSEDSVNWHWDGTYSFSPRD